MTHVTYRLTAKNRDQFRNPTLGNRVWATFTFFIADVQAAKIKIKQNECEIKQMVLVTFILFYLRHADVRASEIKYHLTALNKTTSIPLRIVQQNRGIVQYRGVTLSTSSFLYWEFAMGSLEHNTGRIERDIQLAATHWPSHPLQWAIAPAGDTSPIYYTVLVYRSPHTSPIFSVTLFSTGEGYTIAVFIGISNLDSIPTLRYPYDVILISCRF